ncbi:MAG: hypothetical protein IPN18_10610 [Ignavibacteriales bacterium]|nr:hypothetical protein [Ignavibacteriales bacterium]
MCKEKYSIPGRFDEIRGTALTINRINQVDLLTIQSEIASNETQLLILAKQRDAENYRLNRFLGRG